MKEEGYKIILNRDVITVLNSLNAAMLKKLYSVCWINEGKIYIGV